MVTQTCDGLADDFLHGLFQSGDTQLPSVPLLTDRCLQLLFSL